MPSEAFNNEQFFSEFIDDLYAECDERLNSIRKNLLALESFVGKPSLEQTLPDTLLRHFHTIKGLAGSINLEKAEQLAHHIENYLREIRVKEVLSEEGISALFTGTKLLEQIIIAHRTHETSPNIESIIANLKTVTSGITSPDSVTPSSIQTTKQAITQLWQFEFVPTSERREQGIDVNEIRKRIEAIGEIVESKPRLADGEAGMVFDFTVATTAIETDFADWEKDGLSYTLCAKTSPVESSPTPDLPIASPNITPTVNPVSSLASSNMIRVDMARLDELMRMIGDLVISRSRQENNIKKLKSLLPITEWRNMQETNLAMERHMRDLREGVMRVRLVSIGTAFERMQFVVRDMVSDKQKSVKLELIGQDTEIDKFVVDKMIDPLLHLVRNAVSHGIEPIAERIKQNKPPEGKITLRAKTVGDAMLIEIEDDGCGIDVDEIIKKAQIQLIEIDETSKMTTLLDILCQPGFTTQTQVNLASGRGVGMDVVKNTVNELGGFICLDTQKGIGTRFSIQLPLTLAITDALIVFVGGEKFAIPRLSVHEVIKIEKANLTILENNNEILNHRGNALSLLYLNRLFNLPTNEQSESYALIIGGINKLGIVVERILEEREIVVHALKDSLVQVPGFAGASELGDGLVILILDVVTLARIGS